MLKKKAWLQNSSISLFEIIIHNRWIFLGPVWQMKFTFHCVLCLLRKQVEVFVFEMWKYYRLLSYLYDVQEFSLYSEVWCFVYMFHGCKCDFCICSRDIPFCSCDRVSCLVACCGRIHWIAWSMQVMCLWFYSIFIILILFIYPDFYLISDM
jgi:hypothetical protein